MTWLRRAPLAVVAVMIVTACSLGPQEEPRLVDLPARERELPVGTEAGPEAVDTVEFTATLYLIADNDRLVPVAREVTSDGSRDGQITAIFRALVDGPSDEEADIGLRSAVPPATVVLESSATGTSVTLDLSAAFASIGGKAELLAVGQLVVTATTFPGVQSLNLRLDGTPIDVPLPTGALTDQAVTLRQFSALLDP
ncbi:GerMN domain-containing protein [Actinospongicola halichondriae]|uniref:GerMN domain-containing protein n=1 Tax=Actinospongicola halichondriae TaxID=3236844 RepID=UPI003D38914F